uniref:RING-Gid-type domain-containing protein n=1 Tax=Ditylenchus dipsaci TaxID=166011 RepID=A0A915E4F2_9BILA
MMLPNGRVYGEKSIRRLTKDREICCPRTNEVFSIDDSILGTGLGGAPPPPGPAPAPAPAANGLASLGQFSSLLSGAVPQGGGGGAGGAANAAQSIMAAFSNSGGGAGGNNPFGEFLSLGSAIGGGAPPPPPPGPSPPDLPSLPIPTFAPATPPSPALTWPPLPSTTVPTPSPAATVPPNTPLPFQPPPMPPAQPSKQVAQTSRPAPDYYDGQSDSNFAPAPPPPPPERFRQAVDAPPPPPPPEGLDTRLNLAATKHRMYAPNPSIFTFLEQVANSRKRTGRLADNFGQNFFKMLDEIHEYSNLTPSPVRTNNLLPNPGTDNSLPSGNALSDFSGGLTQRDARRANDFLDANHLMRAFLRTMSKMLLNH